MTSSSPRGIITWEGGECRTTNGVGVRETFLLYSEAMARSLFDEIEVSSAPPPNGGPERERIFDPFAGMGTTLFASMLQGIDSIGIDRLPVATFIAQTLPKFLLCERGQLWATFERLARMVPAVEPAPVAMDVAIVPLEGGD